MEQDLEDGVMLAEMADEEGDEGALEDARASLRAIKERAARAELEALLSGEADGNDAYLEVNSGAGGTESNAGPRRTTTKSRSRRTKRANRRGSSRPPS